MNEKLKPNWKQYIRQIFFGNITFLFEFRSKLGQLQLAQT